jgi:cation:H+ antiporter
VALGAVVGSNIFNILAILGTTAVVSPKPIPVPPGFLSFDLPVMLGGALILTLLIWRRRPIGRLSGSLLLAGYVGYLVMRFAGA